MQQGWRCNTAKTPPPPNKGAPPTAQEQHFGVGYFDSADALRDYLSKHNLYTGEWGRGQAKAAEDLLSELNNAESTLVLGEDGSVLRCLRVVRMRLQRPESDNFLIEAKTILMDGRELAHGRMPGVMMEVNEAWRDAAIRGAREKLGDDKEVSYAELLLETDELKPSASYPELMSRYTFYEVELRIGGLPSASFSTSVQKKGKTKEYSWEWCAQESNPASLAILVDAPKQHRATLSSVATELVNLKSVLTKDLIASIDGSEQHARVVEDLQHCLREGQAAVLAAQQSLQQLIKAKHATSRAGHLHTLEEHIGPSPSRSWVDEWVAMNVEYYKLTKRDECATVEWVKAHRSIDQRKTDYKQEIDESVEFGWDRTRAEACEPRPLVFIPLYSDQTHVSPARFVERPSRLCSWAFTPALVPRLCRPFARVRQAVHCACTPRR